METIDDTGFGGIRIIQDSEGFRYGIDAVLLADFAGRCCPGARRAADLGCGNGIVSLLLAGQKADRRLTGIDFQEGAIRLAQKSCELNGLQDRVSFLQGDIAELQQTGTDLQASMDLVVSNPPYVARGSGIPGARPELFYARQETTADLEDFIAAAAWLLRDRGSFCMVHRPVRLVDIFSSCRSNRLEPKRIRFVHPRQGQPPNIVLLHCIMGGGRELSYDPPLCVYKDQGGYSDEIMEIYRKTK